MIMIVSTRYSFMYNSFKRFRANRGRPTSRDDSDVEIHLHGQTIDC